jgi:CheY-like chemotaxis protein
MLRILLADDSRFFRTIERQFLQKIPAQVVEAVDSDDLFAQLRTEKPQLLFLAFAMRPLNGAECCRQIKSDPALRDLPVIMICDQDMPAQLAAAQHAGSNAILVKPLDRLRFLQAGRQFLNGIREHRQPCFMPVHFDWDGTAHRGKTLDISSGGMFVESAVDLPVGTVLPLVFTLPGTDRPCSCQGEVAWHNRRPNPLKPHYPVGFGIKFRNLPKHLADELNRLEKR